MPETQSTIGAWADEAFGPADPLSPRTALRVLEEVVELCLAAGAGELAIAETADRVLLREFEKHSGSLTKRLAGHERRNPAAIAKETADVAVTLYRCAGVYGFDLHEQVDRVMERNRARKWKRLGDGTGQHIKEAAE